MLHTLNKANNERTIRWFFTFQVYKRFYVEVQIRSLQDSDRCCCGFHIWLERLAQHSAQHTAHIALKKEQELNCTNDKHTALAYGMAG